MSRLAKRFLISISSVLIIIILLSLYLNTKFIERYYIYQKKNQLHVISEELLSYKEQDTLAIKKIEEEKPVVIIKIKNISDIDLMNESLYNAFLEKGVALQKYWLWEEDYKSTIQEGNKLRIYRQGKLNYSLMVEYLLEGDNFFAVAMIIPNVSETISLVNKFTIIIFGSAVLILILILYYLIRKITKPIELISKLAMDISNQHFYTVNIKTGDEIQELATHINDMSIKLEQNQNDLKQKNKQMKLLLSHVSHDLKTPVTLIKAYSFGIKDGMDDGTFIDTIIKQNETMEKMIERLLELSRWQQQSYPITLLDLSELLNKSIVSHNIMAREKMINLVLEIESQLTLMANEESIMSVFDNLLENAIKYTADDRIHIVLEKSDKGYYFAISNGIMEQSQVDLEQIWNPFYVGEKSRNKGMSGTGLGLAIVRAIAEKYGYTHGVTIKNQEMTIWIHFI